jgi:large subunit ribosomal protein L2
MKVIEMNPTSPGRRFVVKVKNNNLHTGKPYKPLLDKKINRAGRNNKGRITMRHQGGGHKQRYRLIDFKRYKDNIVAKVKHIEYDPNRTANIALLIYKDGEKRYIISPEGLSNNMSVVSGENVEIKIGNCMPINNIPLGTSLHNVEIKPGKGAQLARSAGSFVNIVSKDNLYAVLRLCSGEMRKVLLDCRAVIGVASNVKHNLKSIGKAGANRWLGIRSTVRGVAMNPIDHPHGGGEGRTSGGRHPVSPWGLQTKGKKTRVNRYSDYLIVKSRCRN